MKRSILIVTGALLLAASPLLAHHGLTTYDTAHLATLKGTVSKFEFINPHAVVRLEVKDERGQPETWAAEIAPPAMLYRIGWDKNTLKSGDAITVSGYPAKDGSRLLSVRKLILPNGQELNQAPK